MEKDLVDALIAEQMRLEISDRAFARKLGVSSTLWGLTKRRKLSPGYKIISAAVREFPTLANEAVRQLQVA